MKPSIQLSSSSRVLFQGDSITDAKRDRSGDQSPDINSLGRDLGRGYAMLLAAHYQLTTPGISVQNLGISGNRITDLYARAQEHVWNHQPDLLSVLIGVNETWHHFKRSAGVPITRYRHMYRQFLSETLEHVPGVQLVLGHPFILPCGECGPGWAEDLAERRDVVDELAKEFNAIIVPYQTAFDQAQEHAPPVHWAYDGVHPTAAGFLLMARTWLQAVHGSSTLGQE